MIKIFLDEYIIQKITRFYINSVERWYNRKQTDRLYVDEIDGVDYVMQKAYQNAQCVIDVMKEDLNDLYSQSRQKTTYKLWKSKKYEYFKYAKWFFAFKTIKTNENGQKYIIVEDAIYEAEYTNDKFDQTLYETIIKDISKIVKKAILEHYKQ